VSSRCTKPSLLAQSPGVGFLAAALVLVSCHRDVAPAPPLEVRATWPAPDVEEHLPCGDVGDLRVCWGADATSPRVVLRRAPPFALSSLGFRVSGSGKDARAVDRARDAPSFVCDGDTCRQANPRLPDDGEWECADFASVVVCHGGLSPAGVPPGGADTGFSCGARRGAHAAPGERVCVDTSPDLPDGAARGYRCRFEAVSGPSRTCRKDPKARSVTDPCIAPSDCETGLLCASGRCLPPRPSPSCWLDRDCDKGTCRFGSCAPERS